MKNEVDKVSLILTTYNNEKNLFQTLESILQQDYTNIEVIIIDGGSTDETINIIKCYSTQIKELHWISESDSGLYDAMNKGYRLATGHILAFFNDVFLDNKAISKLVRAMNEENCQGAHADLVYVVGSKVKRYWKMGQGKLSCGWLPGHPTLYLRREVYEKYGLYDSAYKCSADYEFMIRILADGSVKLAYVPETLVSMYYGGTSTAGINNYFVSLKEGHRALKDNEIPFAWWIDVQRTVRVMLQFVAAWFY